MLKRQASHASESKEVKKVAKKAAPKETRYCQECDEELEVDNAHSEESTLCKFHDPLTQEKFMGAMQCIMAPHGYRIAKYYDHEALPDGTLVLIPLEPK